MNQEMGDMKQAMDVAKKASKIDEDAVTIVRSKPPRRLAASHAMRHLRWIASLSSKRKKMLGGPMT